MASTTFSTIRTTQGFSAQVGGLEARRQLRISVGVVVTVAIGIVSAALTVGSHPLSVNQSVISTSPVTTLHADSNVVGAKPI